MTDPEPGDFGGNDRFVVLGRLGAGGFGVVYKVFDRERNAVVALKTLRRLSPRSLLRFKQEFRSLADVSHPNLVTLYELGMERDQWFFTMELVEGRSFLRHVSGSGNASFHTSSLSSASGLDSPTSSESEVFFDSPGRRGSASEDASGAPGSDRTGARLRVSLLQLSEGIAALHAAGKLHRDIKPSNVLVTREGRVALLDFGLVKELEPDHSLTVDSAGTPAYMSPEQAAGLPLTEASDWYNVGVMLYEALSGRLPFEGSTAEVLRKKQEEEPPLPSDVAPAVDAELNLLCRDLLRHDPKLRPSGAEVLRRLRGAAGSASVPEAPPPAAAPGPPFVGRTRELEALRDAFRKVEQGQAVTVAVHGSSGVGKSALVRRFLETLREASRDAVVLSGRCYERESVPYKALDSLIDSLSQHLRRLPSAQAEALLPHDIFALVRLFPVLRQVKAVARARRAVIEVQDSQELRRRAFAALRELLVRLADRGPLVLFIDDMQWGDQDSAVLLEALLRPPDPPALLLIGCYRSEETATSPLLRTVLPMRDGVGPSLERCDIPLRELQPDEAVDLALLLLGPDSEQRARARTIANESSGNPFFLEELARFDPGLATTADATLDTVITSRVSQVPDAARRLLDVVAVAGRPIELDVAYRASELDAAGASALAVVRSAHLVRVRATPGKDAIETYHDRIRDSIVARMAPESLRECHQRLALALHASGRADAERLVVHFQAAGDLTSAAEYAVTAATKAAEALAFDRAANLYRLALGLHAQTHAPEGDLQVRLGDALANAGRGAEASQAYLSAARRSGPAQAIDLHRRAAQQLLASGHIEDGVRALNTVLKQLDMTLPATSRDAWLRLFWRRLYLRVRGLRFRARDESQVSPQALLRIDTCWSVAVGLSQIDMLRGAAFQAQNLMLALAAGEPYRVARAVAVEVAYVAMGGSRSRERTEGLLAAAGALAARVDRPHTTALSTLTAGTSAWLDGRWKQSRELCERAELLLRERCSDVMWEILTAQVFQIAALFFLGEVKEMSLRTERLLEDAEEHGNLLRATVLRLGYASHIVWLAADDPGRARKEMETGFLGWRKGHFDYLHIWARSARIDIDLYSGEPQHSPDAIPESHRVFARTLDRFVQMGHLRGLESRARRRLAGAAAAEEPRAREEHLRGVSDQARRILAEKTAWAEPIALLLQAGARATRGEGAEAIALLEQAEKAFVSADMALYAAVARRRRGEMLRGDDGRALVATADASMTAQAIRNPERIAAMLAPGGWRPA